MIIKICGLTDLHNAKTVRSANADFMGFVFVPGSKRNLIRILQNN